MSSDAELVEDELQEPEITVAIGARTEPGWGQRHSTMIHRFNVYGQPDTDGPYWDKRTIRPVSITLTIYGQPLITLGRVNRVGQITVHGRLVLADGTLSKHPQRIDFFAGASRTDPIPLWLGELLAAEGFEYGA